jgi:hypothetical protein
VWFALRRPHRLALTFLAVAVPLAGCGGGGGGDDRATVEASLRHYFSTFIPEDSIFPTGDGPPHVKDNGCKDLHRKFPDGGPGMRPALPPAGGTFRPGGSRAVPTTLKKVALWHCFVRFKHFTLTVQVAVNDSTEVVWAFPVYGDSRKAPRLSPARTYTG